MSIIKGDSLQLNKEYKNQQHEIHKSNELFNGWQEGIWLNSKFVQGKMLKNRGMLWMCFKTSKWELQ